MDNLDSLASELDSALGVSVSPALAKRVCRELAAAHPGAAAPMLRASRQGPRAGFPVRLRWDTLYSTAFIQWDAAGAPPANPNLDLYTRGQGDVDANTGLPMTLYDTNLKQGGRMDSAQQFVALRHGFTLFWATQAGVALADADLQGAAMFVAWEALNASIRTGQQTDLLLGPIDQYPGYNTVPVSFGGGVIVGGGSLPLDVGQAMYQPQGWQSFRKLKPAVTFGAGQTYSVPMRLDPSPANALPTNAALLNHAIGVRHAFYGYSITTIDG